jgi:hypothetical protein
VLGPEDTRYITLNPVSSRDFKAWERDAGNTLFPFCVTFNVVKANLENQRKWFL